MQMSNTVLLLRGHTDSVTTLTLSDRLLASGSDDGTVYFWSFEESLYPTLQTLRMGPCSAVKFDPLNSDIIYSAHSKCIYTWDLRFLHSFISEWNVNEDEINSIDLLPCEPRLASADDSGAVQVIDTSHGHVIRTLKKHDNICSIAKFRPGRTWQLISGGLDCRVIVSDWKGTGLGVIIFELSEIVNPPYFGIPQSSTHHQSLEQSNRGSSDSHASTNDYADLDYDELQESDQDTDDDEEEEEEDEESSRRPYSFLRARDDRARSRSEDRSNLTVAQLHSSTSTVDLPTSHHENEMSESPAAQTSSVSAVDAWSFGLPVNPPMVHSIACSASGDLVAAGLERSTIELFAGDGKRLTHLKSLFGHRRAVSALHFLGDDYLVSGGNDSNLFLWTIGLNAEGQRIFHGTKINAIEGRELSRMYIADYSPVIRCVDMSMC